MLANINNWQAVNRIGRGAHNWTSYLRKGDTVVFILQPLHRLENVSCIPNVIFMSMHGRHRNPSVALALPIIWIILWDCCRRGLHRRKPVCLARHAYESPYNPATRNYIFFFFFLLSTELLKPLFKGEDQREATDKVTWSFPEGTWRCGNTFQVAFTHSYLHLCYWWF